MPSPFPGMDPFLEIHWPDVHAALALESRNALNRGLPGDLVASVEERVAIDVRNEDDEVLRRYPYRPDVKIAESAANWGSDAERDVAIATLKAPFVLEVPQPGLERSVHITEIVRPGDERLVTVIEFLSPANKIGVGRQEYRSRRAHFLEAGVNLVEIDLVRQGDWRALLYPAQAPSQAVSTYRATLHIPTDPGIFLYPLPLREPLRLIPIPLRPKKDPFIDLDLQTLLNMVYDSGRYERRLRYDRPFVYPIPPLDPEDAAWAASITRR